MHFTLFNRLGELEFIKSLGLTLFLTLSEAVSLSDKNFYKEVNKSHTILIHGGGNFGDLYRHHQYYALKLIKNFNQNLIISMPQTINYRNVSLALQDSRIFSIAPNYKISTRSNQSYQFALENFPKTDTLLVPDIAFMIGKLNK